MNNEHALESAVGGLLDIPRSVETPSLVVDLDRVQTNLDEMASFAREHNVALVPHVKTHRTPQFADLQMRSGASALCVAKLSEAEEFRRSGFRTFVMAYPIVGEEKFERAKRFVRDFF